MPVSAASDPCLASMFRRVVAKNGFRLSTGAVLSVESVDANTRKIGSTIIAYEIQARG